MLLTIVLLVQTASAQPDSTQKASSERQWRVGATKHRRHADHVGRTASKHGGEARHAGREVEGGRGEDGWGRGDEGSVASRHGGGGSILCSPGSGRPRGDEAGRGGSGIAKGAREKSRKASQAGHGRVAGHGRGGRGGSCRPDGPGWV